MATLTTHPVHIRPQPSEKAMPVRTKHEGLKLTIQVLTLVVLAIGVAEVFTALGRRDESLSETRTAFKEFAKETQTTLSALLQSEAALHSDMVNLNNRVDRLERRP